MRKILILTAFGILYGLPSNAESTKFVKLPNGGMVPCDHPLAISAGLGCSRPVTVIDYDCNSPINPYSEPDRAAFCAARTIPKPDPVKNWQIGQRYKDAYENKVIVIGVTRDIFDRRVVTYQYYTGSMLGLVNSFIEGVTGQPLILIEE